MTKPFATRTDCPHCGASHTVETAFGRWMRHEPALDSREGIVCFDCDILLHRYQIAIDKGKSREIQCLMFVEVKTFNADMSPSQRDTMTLFSQVLKNLRSDRRGRKAGDHKTMALAFSWLLGRSVRLRMFGGHLLQLSGADPLTSDTMKWDHKPITRDQLVALLRFELDPHSLQPIDWRRHHAIFQVKKIWDWDYEPESRS